MTRRRLAATLQSLAKLPIPRMLMADFAPIVEKMKLRYDLRVRRWRTNMSGCAWRVYHHDGRVVNWVESPYPKTPISLAIFLHEVGHHVIGFEKYRRRGGGEDHVWGGGVERMKRLGGGPGAGGGGGGVF